MSYLFPEDVPEEDFTTVTDVNDIYDLFNKNKISLEELDRLKNEYYTWYYSPERHDTVLRFFRQVDGTMTIHKQTYIRAYGEEGVQIAQQLGNGVIYHGSQFYKGEFITHIFEDAAVTGTSFAGKNFEEAKDGLIEARQGFKAKPPEFLPKGTCYEDAWRFLIKEGEGHLIHGSVQLSAEGPRVNHAWVEFPTGWIWEPQTGSYYTIEDFKIMNPAEEYRYTVEEAAIMVARTSKHGPWTSEERR